ncbi:hypothetical protein ACA910_016236 [Epithemia clementina (nom. ined.)]
MILSWESDGSTGEQFSFGTEGAPSRADGDLTREGSGIGICGSGLLFGLVRVLVDEFADWCCGKVGAGRHRICAKARAMCTTVSHDRAKYQWSTLLGTDEGSAVFFQGSPGDAPQVETVFGSPVLPGLLVADSDWAKLELSPQLLLSWQATF